MSKATTKGELGSLLREIGDALGDEARTGATNEEIAGLTGPHPDLETMYRWCAQWDLLLELNEGPDWLSISQAAESTRMLRETAGESFPRTLIPIATDGSGNFACHDAQTGRVLDWDHETRRTRAAAPNLAAYLRKEVVKLLRRAPRDQASVQGLGVKTARPSTRAQRPTKLVKLPRADLRKLDREGYAGGACRALLVAHGRVLLTFQNVVALWELEGQRELAKARLSGDCAAAVHDASGRAVMASFDTMTLCDGELKPIAIWGAHDGRIWDVAFSPDGRLAASSGQHGHLALWDVADQTGLPKALPKTPWEKERGTPTATLKGHSDIVQWVAFSPEPGVLASGGWDKTVRLWDVKARREVARANAHSARVECGAFSPDGTSLVTGSESGELIVFDASIGVRRKWTADRRVSAVAFISDDRVLSIGRELVVWDVATGEKVASAAAPKPNSRWIHASVQGSLVLMTGSLALYQLR